MIINLKSIRFGKSLISIILAHGCCDNAWHWFGHFCWPRPFRWIFWFGLTQTCKSNGAFFHSCSVLPLTASWWCHWNRPQSQFQFHLPNTFLMPTEFVSVCAFIKKLRGHWPTLCWHREGDSQPCIWRKQLLLKCLNGFLSLRLHRFSSTAGGSSSAPSRSPTGRWWPSHRPSRCSRTDGRPPGARPASTPATAAAETSTLHRCLRMASSDFFWSLCWIIFFKCAAIMEQITILRIRYWPKILWIFNKFD